MYRFRVVNGCNARFLNLRFTSGGTSVSVPMVNIGAEQGMFANAVGISSILVVSAERADLIVDFSRLAWQLGNTALPKPYIYAPPQDGGT